ncbi:MAG: hypothetical protein M1282_18335 [Chloroflexi bacterium]|nr:hypothetical protein [Chloroflexota bacterium]
MFSKPFQKPSSSFSSASEIYDNLRNKVLSLNPTDIGLASTKESPNVWGVLMELGYQAAVVTLVSLADGTTSLYFGNGGGMIGGGEHAAVAHSTKNFLAEAEKYYQQMDRTDTFPLPDIGRVKFYILTFAGKFTADADENELGNRKHKFSPLFYRGQDVITQFRMTQEQKKS